MNHHADIPPKMKHLKRDPRGLPIPYIVMIDNVGKPHFQINDHRVVARCIENGLCSGCGTALGSHKWFVGGPAAALYKFGAYIDPPMHRECARYAVQQCPFLSAPVYSNRLETRTLTEDSLPETGAVFIDNTMHPDRPSVFVLADTSSFRQNAVGHLIPLRPWRHVEFWRQGRQISDEAAADILRADETLAVRFDQLEHLWPA